MGFRSKRVATGIAALCLIMVSAAAFRAPDGWSARGARPIPAPSFARLEGTARAVVLSYARSLEFDTSYHATDVARLFTKRDGIVSDGPLARISPEAGILTSSSESMRGGRIVARISSDAVFPELGLAKGDNYLWVDRSGGGLRAVIVPADTSAPAHEYALRQKHVMVNNRRAEARFRWNEAKGRTTIWVPCAQGCCEVDVDWT